ncbi:HlyD family efflux transporter periplasmic adaptor subunit [Sphingomonas sp. AR_OL41]|uniref:HlyD family efflux transporter periplasmic adaptor subunit n=1 Tax=Sphingomonas sp. AR_OL41 TaxID=3042729 RepID=UPI002480E09B|nr:HlyD family efflux transporter periplasmic adaptor subunit [Sphingomonas sp. AR_OL41]MDH7976027.1 HlyD family efflux transporter periplasmic adaptor subunit [Sphingomonas sp. AR_OL41]
MNRRRIAGIVALVALLVAALATRGFGLIGGSDGGGLTMHGNVDIRQVDLGFRVAGRIASIPPEEGAHVAEGAILARLDPAPLQDQLYAAQAQVAVAGAELDKRRNGNRPQDVAQAQAKLADAEANLASAKEEYDRRAELVKTGAVSQALFDGSTAKFRSAQAQVSAARQALSLQRAGARREDIDAAVAQRQQAAAQASKAKTDLSDAELRAPNAGTILTRAREPGAIVQPGETVLTLTIDRPMRVRAYIPEPDLSRIAPGMAVIVTTDGNARRYHGTIGNIAPTAEFTPKTVQTEALRTDLVYRVRIIVNDPDDALRQGAPVTISVPDARAPATR